MQVLNFFISANEKNKNKKTIHKMDYKNAE